MTYLWAVVDDSGGDAPDVYLFQTEKEAAAYALEHFPDDDAEDGMPEQSNAWVVKAIAPQGAHVRLPAPERY